MYVGMLCLVLSVMQGCQSTKNTVMTGVVDNRQEEVLLTVASETRIGYGVGPMACLLVKHEPAEKWQYMYSEIKGFNYEPGYKYRLLVLRVEHENPPQDTSRYMFELIKVLSKEKKGSAGLP